MAKKVTLDNLDKAIEEILDEYAGDIQSNLDVITKKIGQKGAQALRNESKKTFNGKTYASGWTSTAYKERLYTEVIIHNKKQAGLAHLLENGHVKANGTGRYGIWDGRTHIEPIEKELIVDYEREVINKL